MQFGSIDMWSNIRSFRSVVVFEPTFKSTSLWNCEQITSYLRSSICHIVSDWGRRLFMEVDGNPKPSRFPPLISFGHEWSPTMLIRPNSLNSILPRS